MANPFATYNMRPVPEGNTHPGFELVFPFEITGHTATIEFKSNPIKTWAVFKSAPAATIDMTVYKIAIDQYKATLLPFTIIEWPRGWYYYDFIMKDAEGVVVTYLRGKLQVI